MKNRIAFYTFGCRLNQSETSVLERNFEAGGYEIVDLKNSPDIVVVNTCTVTENGDTDTRRLVNKINRLNPNARIALIGCQAQIQKEKLATLPNVRWVIGNAQKMDLASILHDHPVMDKPYVAAPAIQKGSFTVPILTDKLDRTHTRSNLKIQDGCDFFCSFCEIPFARGRARSRVFDDILHEARILAKAGHKEIVLTGVNLGTYRYQQKTLLDILDALEKIKDLRRIRISSIEPTTIPLELIKRMGTTKLCRHLHIPLQSGSNEVLRLMQRKYTAEEFAEFILKACQILPGLCIGTDIIVGFPGETEAHFNETADFVRELPLAYFHVFSYSDRTLNKSRNFKNKIPIMITQERSEILRALSVRKRQIFFQNLIGTNQEVLFEEKKNGFWSGLSDQYVRVAVQTPQNLKNKIVSVRLKSIKGQSILASLS